MKLLVVCRLYNEQVIPFISEQVNSIQELGVDVEWVYVRRGGLLGYFHLWKDIRKTLTRFEPQVIHAHYGLCGFIANLQRKIPVVTTFPGSDINNKWVRSISVIAMRLSKYSIFMCTRQFNLVKRFASTNYKIMPYGIALNKFTLTDKQEARTLLGYKEDEKLVLFSSRFERLVKNPQLAFDALTHLPEVQLLELTGKYSKEDMVLLMHAVDAALMTSHTEGSPQFVKEVMACGCPLVSVDVGDVKEVTAGVEGCYIVSREAEEIAEKLQIALNFKGRTHGRERIVELGLENRKVAETILGIYNNVIAKL